MADIVAGYRADQSPAQLAKVHGISKSALVSLLHEHGLAIRNHGLTPTQRAECKQLREAGLSYVAIAKQFGVHKSTVWHAVNPGHGPARS